MVTVKVISGLVILVKTRLFKTVQNAKSHEEDPVQGWIETCCKIKVQIEKSKVLNLLVDICATSLTS